MVHDLSPNMEMYLKTILQLAVEGEPVRVKAIAQAMGVTMPSVSQALRALKSKGLVSHSSYGAVGLTRTGVGVARAVRERYQVLQRFLIDVLGVEEKVAAEEACQIEHVLRAETMRRLSAFLEFMTHCRMDVESVIEHFHEYLQYRQAGERCPDCELGVASDSSAQTPER